MTAGAYVLWPSDKDGNPIGYQSEAEPAVTAEGEARGTAETELKVVVAEVIGPAHPPAFADPSNEAAVDIYFGVRSDLTEAAPKDQVELQDKIQKVLRTIQVLYLLTDTTSERTKRQFRSYYVRLFRLGQVGLEGKNVSTDIASAAMATTMRGSHRR